MNAKSYVKLDQWVAGLLRCPSCKELLTRINESKSFSCSGCNSRFDETSVGVDQVPDLRIKRPAYAVPPNMSQWERAQGNYEAGSIRLAGADSLRSYQAEIESVREIYEDELAPLQGLILDVGGHQGRLRHFVAPDHRDGYVCVDPYVDTFANLEKQTGLLDAYPVLKEPCNFLGGHAESLPFATQSFDVVHMRSVLDHFFDPFLALKEAARVLRPGGRLIVGVTVVGGNAVYPERSIWLKLSERIRTVGLTGTMRAIAAKLRGDKADEVHLFRWHFEELLDATERSGFTVAKEHWQKAPYTMCVYIEAERPGTR